MEHLTDCRVGRHTAASSPCTPTLVAGLVPFVRYVSGAALLLTSHSFAPSPPPPLFIFLLWFPIIAIVLQGPATDPALYLMNSSGSLLCIFHFLIASFSPMPMSLPCSGHCHLLLCFNSLLLGDPRLQTCIPQSILTAVPVIFPKHKPVMVFLLKTWEAPPSLRRKPKSLL